MLITNNSYLMPDIAEQSGFKPVSVVGESPTRTLSKPAGMTDSAFNCKQNRIYINIFVLFVILIIL